MFIAFQPHLMMMFYLNPPHCQSQWSLWVDARIYRKHDGHAWCKVKTTNIKNDFNLTFQKACYLGHLQCRNDGCDFFLLNECRNETTWIGEVVHDLQGGFFADSPPFCKMCNNTPFYVNLCATHMYYIVHK